MQSTSAILKEFIGIIKDNIMYISGRIQKMTKPSVNKFPANELINRKCAHCDEEEKNLQRKENNSNSILDTGTIDTVLNSSGKNLDKDTRSFMESRFNHDFSDIKIHDDELAAKSASSMNALAYTSGNNIVFNSGQYNSSTDTGRRLLAHELTHALQQQDNQGIQRKIEVEDPTANTDGSSSVKNWEEARKQIRALNPAFDVNSSGQVFDVSGGSCKAGISATRDKCLCDLASSASTWKIILNNNEWPHTIEGGKTVTVQNSFSKLNFGAWGGGPDANKRVLQSNERVLGHELCGHAWLMEKGTHPAFDPRTSASFGRPSHSPTVQIENKIADEIAGANAPDRGLFADPHQGESFGKISIARFGLDQFDVMSSPEKSKIMTISKFMKDLDIKADIIGHSDGVGSADAIKRMGELRATDVKNTLMLEGVKSTQFRLIKGVGNSECTSGSANDPACRKVDVFMFLFEASSAGP